MEEKVYKTMNGSEYCSRRCDFGDRDCLRNIDDNQRG